MNVSLEKNGQAYEYVTAKTDRVFAVPADAVCNSTTTVGSGSADKARIIPSRPTLRPVSCCYGSTASIYCDRN